MANREGITLNVNGVDRNFFATEANIEGELGSDVDASEINSGTATSGQVLTANGTGGASWAESSGGLTSVKASDVDSESATSGQVLTANGNGGATWETPESGGGGSSVVANPTLSGNESSLDSITIDNTDYSVGKKYVHKITITNANRRNFYFVIYTSSATPLTTKETLWPVLQNHFYTRTLYSYSAWTNWTNSDGTEGYNYRERAMLTFNNNGPDTVYFGQEKQYFASATETVGKITYTQTEQYYNLTYYDTVTEI